MTSRQDQFTALVQAYGAELYRIAYWLCKTDSARAEDLVQETFVRAWKSLESLLDDRKAKGWLITILRREFYRDHARNKNRPELRDDHYVEQLIDPAQFSTSGSIGLQRALQSLPDNYREPLLLQVLGGYSCDEIASLMELKPGAVMTRVFRARQAIKKLLGDDDIFQSESMGK